MNFLKCNISENDYCNIIVLDSNGARLQFPINKFPFKLSAEKNIIIGIRPRNILFLDNRDFNGIKLKGKISFNELLGDDSLVEIKISFDDSIKVAKSILTLILLLEKMLQLESLMTRFIFLTQKLGIG